MNEYLETAADMLNCDAGQLHYQFVQYLKQIAGYVQKTGGLLGSRQVIGKAIVDWELITGQKARSE